MKLPKLTKAEKAELKKWAKNLLMFTAPILAGFFYELSVGVPLEKAWPLALLALYGALYDLFKKYKEVK